MRTEAASGGFYASPGWGGNYPRLQILTVAELLGGGRIDMPPIRQVSKTFKKAPRAKGKKDKTAPLPALDTQEGHGGQDQTPEQES
jgi:hypothetical protein